MYTISAILSLTYMGSYAEACSALGEVDDSACGGRIGAVIAMGLLAALFSLGAVFVNVALANLHIQLAVGGVAFLFSLAGAAVVTSPKTTSLSHFPIISWLGALALLTAMFSLWDELDGNSASDSTAKNTLSGVPTSTSPGLSPGAVPMNQPGAYAAPQAAPATTFASNV